MWSYLAQCKHSTKNWREHCVNILLSNHARGWFNVFCECKIIVNSFHWRTEFQWTWKRINECMSWEWQGGLPPCKIKLCTKKDHRFENVNKSSVLFSMLFWGAHAPLLLISKNDCNCMFTLCCPVNYPVCNNSHTAQYVTTKRRRRRVGFLVGKVMKWYAYLIV